MSTRTTRSATKASDNSADTAKTSKSSTNSSSTNKAKKPANNDAKAPPAKANTSRKRKVASSTSKNASTPTSSKRSRKDPSTSSGVKKSKPSEADLAGGAKMASAWMKNRDKQFAEGAGTATSTSSSPTKNAKANPYNLTPGTSPYPNYPRPTPAECQHVNDILAAIHGRVSAPKTVPVPSLNSSGCGEVPSVLDALIRTRLSAATNNENSSRAFRGLVQKFGVIKEGVGKGSVDWNKVRLANQSDIFEAIRTGGLADVKSRDIKKILQSVYEENQARKSQLKEEGQDEDSTNKIVIEKAEANIVSLDHLHELPSEDAFNKLVQYPGVGPKTASCVLLFCMQRPSFAVDTHVFRLTRWLGWTPSDAELKRMAKDGGAASASASAEAKTKSTDTSETTKFKPEELSTPPPTSTPSKKAPNKRTRGPPPVTRNSTYSHLDVRIPDELKYPLHYLLIKHGKMCPECSAKPDKAVKEAWGKTVCPLKELKREVKRGGSGKAKGKAKDGDEAVKEEEDDEDAVETGDEDLDEEEDGSDAAEDEED